MDRPLGRSAGNALEVEESVNALKGHGPEDLMEVTMAEAVEMLLLAGRKSADEARAELTRALKSGAAAKKFEEIIEAQGGNPAVVDDPAILPQAAEVEVYLAPNAGVVLQVEPRTIGKAVVQMGGGRSKTDDVVDPTVGFVISARPGQRVSKGEPLASIYARDPAGIDLARKALDKAVRIGEGKAELLPLIAERLTA
jgi:pyrimidine-nucleoside phosphorylase